MEHLMLMLVAAGSVSFCGKHHLWLSAVKCPASTWLLRAGLAGVWSDAA